MGLKDLFRRSPETGPDGFPLPRGEGRAVHDRVSKLLEEYAANPHLSYVASRDLGQLSSWEALGAAPREDQRAFAIALVERGRWIRARGARARARDSEMPSSVAKAIGGVEPALELLLRRTLPFTWEDVESLADDALDRSPWSAMRAWAGVLRIVESRAEAGPIPEPVRERLARGRKALAPHEHREFRAVLARMDALLEEGRKPAVDLTAAEPWSERALSDLAAMEPGLRDRWAALLLHASGSSPSQPPARWLKGLAPLVAALGVDELAHRLVPWFELVASPAPADADPWSLRPSHEDVLRGLAWACGAHESKPLARALGRLALTSWRKLPGRGPRAQRIGNACVWALGAMPGTEGVGQLALLKVKVRFRPALAAIEKALTVTARRLDMGREDVEELGVPTYGLTEVGVRRQVIGETRAELHVTGTSSTEIRWLRSDGKPQKTAPAAVREAHAEELAELKEAAKDVQRMLPAQRDRIDRLALARKSWSFAAWRERYLDHPLVGTLARRLIWTFGPTDPPGESRSGAWGEGRLVDAEGRALDAIAEDARVELWHPLTAGSDEVGRWRAWLAAHEVSQPFKQAHREIYPLTPAERATRIYSNRFAAHIVKQHQFHALCQARGWRHALRLMVDQDAGPATLDLPAWGLRAEFWVEGAGTEYREDTNETGTYLRLATDQLRFHRLESTPSTANMHGGGYRAAADPVPLEEVPALVFSEVMRDADLFVGVASVGNDPTWFDGGPGGRAVDAWERFAFGELAESALTRKQALETLVPRLAIRDRCSFVDRFLVVRGDRRTYKIHLGSGNIRMEPDDAYLCIVPDGATREGGEPLYLPFEGDRTLALVLSKAFLLANDAKIRDATILAQIQRR